MGKRGISESKTEIKLYEMGPDTEKIAQVVGYAVDTIKGWIGLV